MGVYPFRFRFARGFTTSRALSMNRFVTGLSVRSFKVMMPTGHGRFGKSTGSTLSGANACPAVTRTRVSARETAHWREVQRTCENNRSPPLAVEIPSHASETLLQQESPQQCPAGAAPRVRLRVRTERPSVVVPRRFSARRRQTVDHRRGFQK